MSGQNGAAAAGQNQTGANPASEATQTVPVSVVEALRNELKDLKTQNQQLNQTVHAQTAMLQSAASQQANQGRAQEDEDEDTVITLKEARALIQKAVAPLVGASSETAMRAKHADYDEVLKAGLPQALTEDPSLRQAIASSQNPHLLAYRIAKTYIKQEEKNTDPPKAQDPTPAELAKKVADNANKPGSASQAGSGGGGLKDVNKYAAMSDDEFNAEIARIKRG